MNRWTNTPEYAHDVVRVALSVHYVLADFNTLLRRTFYTFAQAVKRFNECCLSYNPPQKKRPRGRRPLTYRRKP